MRGMVVDVDRARFAVLGGTLGGATRGAVTADANFSREGSAVQSAYPAGAADDARRARPA